MQSGITAEDGEQECRGYGIYWVIRSGRETAWHKTDEGLRMGVLFLRLDDALCATTFTGATDSTSAAGTDASSAS